MGIVPNRSGSPQGVLQALWRNLFRSNPFHFGSADETELVWLADARSVRDCADLNVVGSTGRQTKS